MGNRPRDTSQSVVFGFRENGIVREPVLGGAARADLLGFDLEGAIAYRAGIALLDLIRLVTNIAYFRRFSFAEADLTEAVFKDCDLSGAIFDYTVLEKADLRTAQHYSIDPENNRLKKARFSIFGIAGLLDKYDIDIEH